MLFRGHCRLMSMTADSPAWTDEIRREVGVRVAIDEFGTRYA